MYTREQVLKGIVKYAENDLINLYAGTNIEIGLRIAIPYLFKKEKYVNKLFENKYLKILEEPDGTYDIDADILMQAFGDGRKLRLYIKKLSAILPDGETLALTRADIEKIIKYMEE